MRTFVIVATFILAFMVGLWVNDIAGSAPQDEKPYIYYDPVEIDPNVVIFGGPIDVVCTKHGRLNYGEQWIFSDSKKAYCARCVYDVLQIYLDKHLGEEVKEKK